MKNIFINPTKKVLISLSMLLSMLVCKSIVKPVYAELQEKEKKQNTQEANNLIIYKEENIDVNIVQNSQDILINQTLNTLNEIVENVDIQEPAIVETEVQPAYNTQTEEQSPWRLIIPKLNLDAGIKEGTTPEILDVNIGHLETTSVFEGTVALCAHNRGYTKNYFSELKNLEIGEVVSYINPQYGTKEYVVIDKQIIASNDWSYTEQSINNKLVLITCVENEPNQRLVVICEEKV